LSVQTAFGDRCRLKFYLQNRKGIEKGGGFRFPRSAVSDTEFK